MILFRSRRPFGAFACAVLALSALSLGLVACSGGDKTSAGGNSKTAVQTRVETIQHEECDAKSNRAEALDTNNDGKTDITRVYDKKTGAEMCRIVDLNHDGKPDLYEYFDANGAIRRREFAYDDTGAVNAIEYYENGKLVRREYDTTGQHRIDTWDFFDPAKPPNPKTGRPVPARRERDTNGDGRIDQWWVWDGDQITITVDKTGDGRPDPENTIVLNANDAGAPPSPPMPAPVGGGDSSDAGARTPAVDAAAAPSPSASAKGGTR
jgi:hypothetical protein